MNNNNGTMGTLGTLGRGNNKSSKCARKRNRSRGWVITENNPMYKTKKKYLAHLAQTFSKSKFYIFGFEIGESGTEHIQGQVYFKNPVEFDSVRKLIPRARIAKQKGSISDNLRYCSKDGEFITNIPEYMKDKKSYFDHIVREMSAENLRRPYENWMGRVFED